ncbi:hypothetical protein FSARC_5826 [Fusarium sarcochroum]|uniref:Uncharacterized protein n=1 Tax=Fusarium sarcochroum TaxID=1208366 RepID=A0A8H4X9Q6_9HYPO|nr:hypothetical protein FSARC_5826 [Fusarium sarcochroum]
MDDNQGDNQGDNQRQYARPQRPYMRDPGIRMLLEQQEAVSNLELWYDSLLIQSYQLNFQIWQLQGMIAHQNFLMMQMMREMHRMELQFQAMKERMTPGLASSPSASGTPGMPDTPNTLQQFRFGTHYNIPTSETQTESDLAEKTPIHALEVIFETLNRRTNICGDTVEELLCVAQLADDTWNEKTLPKEPPSKRKRSPLQRGFEEDGEGWQSPPLLNSRQSEAEIYLLLMPRGESSDKRVIWTAFRFTQANREDITSR